MAETKKYHVKFPGSTFYMPKPHEKKSIQFGADGTHETDDEDVQKELDAIADTPGCPIFTKNGPVDAPGDNAPIEDIKNKAAATIAALKQAAAPKG